MSVSAGGHLPGQHAYRPGGPAAQRRPRHAGRQRGTHRSVIGGARVSARTQAAGKPDRMCGLRE